MSRVRAPLVTRVYSCPVYDGRMDTEETKRRTAGAGTTALAIIPSALVFVFGLLVLFVIAASSGAGGYASIGEGVALLAALFASPICFGMLALPSSRLFVWTGFDRAFPGSSSERRLSPSGHRSSSPSSAW